MTEITTYPDSPPAAISPADSEKPVGQASVPAFSHRHAGTPALLRGFPQAPIHPIARRDLPHKAPAAAPFPPTIEQLLADQPLARVLMPAPTLVNKRTPLRRALTELAHSPSRSLLVMDHDRILGIITPRDILCRVLDQYVNETSPQATKKMLDHHTVTAIMTPHPHTLTDHDSLALALTRMAQTAVSHLPILNARGNVRAILTPAAINQAIHIL